MWNFASKKPHEGLPKSKEHIPQKPNHESMVDIIAVKFVLLKQKAINTAFSLTTYQINLGMNSIGTEDNNKCSSFKNIIYISEWE